MRYDIYQEVESIGVSRFPLLEGKEGIVIDTIGPHKISCRLGIREGFGLGYGGSMNIIIIETVE